MTPKQQKKNKNILSLTAEERETIICCSDADPDKIFIYTSQQPMMRKLFKNPLFKVKDKQYNPNYRCFPHPISLTGILPKKAVMIRKKIRKLTIKERKKVSEQLEHARKSRKSWQYAEISIIFLPARVISWMQSKNMNFMSIYRVIKLISCMAIFSNLQMQQMTKTKDLIITHMIEKPSSNFIKNTFISTFPHMGIWETNEISYLDLNVSQ